MSSAQPQGVRKICDRENPAHQLGLRVISGKAEAKADQRG
jgi:hypothetical protein